ncbi:hypothetical protein B0H63DRAFT_487867 [Podospora didyma]|uniref:Uncharacterized protein n=1 Tax=Podospora didyma TaxID=330526 RepID=A0AAE0N3L5_9PEZI|nr:hypothetical protein B0H63DRAFT_487867 [Podospora didyma]
MPNNNSSRGENECQSRTAAPTLPTDDSSQQLATRRPILPPELMAVLVPSLKVGATVGGLGVFAGAALGIARSAPPALYGLATGGQWFVLSSSFYGARLVGLRVLRADEEIRPGDKTAASAMAGAFAGTVAGSLRGPKNIIPGAIVFTLLGAGGQGLANIFSRKGDPDAAPKKGFLESRWSPVTPLTDQAYERMLEEKLLRVEADLAILDDHIKAVQAEGKAASEKSSENQGSSEK